MMTSRPVLIKVVKALGLDQAEEEEKEQKKGEGVFANFRTFLHFLRPNTKEEKPEQGPDDKWIPLADALKWKNIVNPVLGTQLVDIGVEDPNPQSAMDISNTLS